MVVTQCYVHKQNAKSNWGMLLQALADKEAALAKQQEEADLLADQWQGMFEAAQTTVPSRPSRHHLSLTQETRPKMQSTAVLASSRPTTHQVPRYAASCICFGAASSVSAVAAVSCMLPVDWDRHYVQAIL